MKEQPDKASPVQANSVEVREKKKAEREKDRDLIRELIGLLKDSRNLE